MNRLTLTEFCHLTQLDTDYVEALISVGIIDAGEGEPFDHEQVLRSLKAHRLQQDLELDLSSVALILELLDQNQHLKNRLRHLEGLLQRLRANPA